MHPTDQGLTEERCGEGDDDMELSEWEKEESHPEKRLRLNEDSYKSNNQLKVQFPNQVQFTFRHQLISSLD